MFTSPKISLIIPAYNEEKYIGECLRHVLKYHQGCFHEIIVVDNASTDQTFKIASSFKGVKVIYEKEKGVTRARQRGFLESKGDILAFVDADTHMPEGWARKILDAFKKDEKTVCISGPYVYYDQPVFLQFLTKFLYWYLLAIPMYKIVGYMAVGGNFVIKREVLERTKGFDTSIEFYGEDTDLARRASVYGKVNFIPDLYMYTSNRRLKSQGTLSTAFLYMNNYLSEVVLKKPVTTDYKDIR